MRPRTICTHRPCGNPATVRGRCTAHNTQAERTRGTAHQRGYDAQHRTFRTAVLRRDITCRICHDQATVADHWPLSKRDLRAQGMDDHDPRHGRGLCARCHNRETARHQPGGWAAHA